MSCDTFDAFRYATEDLDQQVSRAASYRSIWLNLIPKGVYPKNVGTHRSVFGIGNIEPTDDSGTWTAIDLSGAGTNTSMDTPLEVCTNDWDDVEWGFDEATYGPERSQLRGPVVCKKDLDFSHDPETFLTAYVQEMAKRAKRQWELWLEANHVRLSAKVSAVTDFEDNILEQAGVNGLDCPDCELTQEMLEILAERLMENGATTPDSNGFITWEDNGPIFPLYIGMRQSQRILRQNSELRQDYRYGDPSTLIGRVGSARVIGNFRHLINQRPRRYTCTNGTFTLVPRMKTATAGDAPTKGTKQIINSAWRTAPYEGFDILSPELFTNEVVAPTNAAGGLSYDPSNYMGDWKFVTGAFKWQTDCEDALEEQGRHYAQFYAAPKPNIVARYKYGFHGIFKRCFGSSVECTTCSSS